MSPSVRLGAGIDVILSTGEVVHLDGPSSDGPPVVSHAHGDHLVAGANRIVSSDLTAALAGVRQDVRPEVAPHPAVQLIPSGHIAGSRAALVTDPATEWTYLYTGDCCIRDRFYLSGFDPPSADVLILEATYGVPNYTFPPTERVISEIDDWLAETMGTVVLLFGYPLGRAQKLQRIVADSPRTRVFVTDAIATLNRVIEDHRAVTFESHRFDTSVDLAPGDAVVLPMQSTRHAWIQSMVDGHDARTAGFSGWAVDRSFRFQRGLDRAFVLSDHCDFEELCEVVAAVEPERVYTHHGFSKPLAQHVTAEFGVEAVALERHQSTFADF